MAFHLIFFALDKFVLKKNIENEILDFSFFELLGGEWLTVAWDWKGFLQIKIGCLYVLYSVNCNSI